MKALGWEKKAPILYKEITITIVLVNTSTKDRNYSNLSTQSHSTKADFQNSKVRYHNQSFIDVISIGIIP